MTARLKIFSAIALVFAAGMLVVAPFTLSAKDGPEIGLFNQPYMKYDKSYWPTQPFDRFPPPAEPGPGPV